MRLLGIVAAAAVAVPCALGAQADSVRKSILRLVLARRGQPGIVYCIARSSAESTAAFLRELIGPNFQP